MSDCIFCKIVAGELPCYKLYENESFLAFLDIFPHMTGHTLVIPKKHFDWVWDVDNIGSYMTTCQKIAKYYRKVSKNDEVWGWIFGYGVPHAHIHILPMLNQSEREQGVKVFESLRREKLTAQEAEALVRKLKLQ